jgi:hypothetical protein
MLTVEDLEVCAEKLYVYDVEQGAWEQEPHGFEANAKHVLTHLAKDIVNKDFSSPELVQTAIAPDSMQYALRLGRWAGVEPQDMLVSPGDEWNVRRLIARQVSRHRGSVIVHATAFAEAMGELASNLHDLDHASTREVAIASRQDAMRETGRLLVNSARLQAEGHQFDLMEAFDARLAHLRERFGIPQPVS